MKFLEKLFKEKTNFINYQEFGTNKFTSHKEVQQ